MVNNRVYDEHKSTSCMKLLNATIPLPETRTLSFNDKIRWVTNFRNSPTSVFKPLYIIFLDKIENIITYSFDTRIGITAYAYQSCMVFMAFGRHINDDVTKGVDILIDYNGCPQ